VSADVPAGEVADLMAAMQVDRLWVADLRGNLIGILSMADFVTSADTEADPLLAGRARRRWWDVPPAATAGDLMTPIAAPAELVTPAATRVPPDAA
jgi:hypothetical protein